MRKYEILYILKPTLNEDEIDKINKNITNIFINEGKILESPKTELKTLAYPIKKFTQGFYIGFLVEANNDMVKEFNRVISITEEIIRYVICRRD